MTTNPESRQLLTSLGYAIGFVAVILVLAGALLVWIVHGRLGDFDSNQTALARWAVRDTGDEIEKHLRNLRHLLGLASAEHSELLRKLHAAPHDRGIQQSVSLLLDRYLPEAARYSLSSTPSPEGGASADSQDTYDPSPGPSTPQGDREPDSGTQGHSPRPGYHFLISTEVTAGSFRGVLHVALEPGTIAALLRSRQPPRHRLLLTRRGKPQVVEVGDMWMTRAPASDHRLSESELDSVLYKRPIRGMDLTLVDVPKPSLFSDYRRGLYIQAASAWGIFLLACVAMLLLLKREESRRTRAERRLRRAHATLEQRVEERTAELERSQEALSYQARHDALTDLPNRRVFEERLAAIVDDATRNGSESALFYMDLDQFKVVNDTAGHTAGDELLRQVAIRLKTHLRTSDILARLGGDEFGVILPSCPLKIARRIAGELRFAVKEYRFTWENTSHDVGISIGVVPITSLSEGPAQVLSTADAACYVAKDSGRNRIHVHEPGDGRLIKRTSEMQLAGRIGQALSEDRFICFGQLIQPVSKVEKGEATWYEILARMRDPAGKIVPAGEFIETAERYGQIAQVDATVLRQTLEWLAERQNRYRVNVNLSGYTLSSEGAIKMVVDQIESSGADPERVCFEITETAVVSNLTRARRFIQIIKGLGCRFALDDFGSGLSSFGYLMDLDVDYIKIDGRFVRDIDRDPVHRALTESIHQIAGVMGRKTIAEFVESSAVLASLQDIGVHYGQGYHLGRPCEISAVTPEASDLASG